MAFQQQNPKKIFNSQLLDNIKMKRNDEVLRLLRTTDFVNLSDYYGNTLLHYATMNGNEWLTHFLINAGCDRNIQNVDLKTPIMLAAEAGHETVVVDLLKANVRLDLLDMYERNVLDTVVDRKDTFSPRTKKMFLDKVERDSPSISKEIAEKLYKSKEHLMAGITYDDVDAATIMLGLGSPVVTTQ